MDTYEMTQITERNWEDNSPRVTALVRAYACRFWGAAWKELLAVRDPEGSVLRQYGTFDTDGTVFPETALLLTQNNVAFDDPDWPDHVWSLASQGALCAEDGSRVSPYWTLESAARELRTFISPIVCGGYGGENLLAARGDMVVGFTAYACVRGEDGRAVANRRFPTRRLYIPWDAPFPTDVTVGEFLNQRYPGDECTFGVFLDHAVSEAARGQGFGSRLFDQRLDRLLELGADVFFGRTLVTEPRQYMGNYRARGLTPVAADGADAFSRVKHYFAATRDDLRPRARRL